jgi:hypothetical protein
MPLRPALAYQSPDSAVIGELCAGYMGLFVTAFVADIQQYGVVQFKY